MEKIVGSLLVCLFVLAGCEGTILTSHGGQEENRFDGGSFAVDQGPKSDIATFEDIGEDISVDLDVGGSKREPCQTPAAVFERETWPKAGSAICVGCHIKDGIAADGGSTLVLKDERTLGVENLSLDAFYAFNLDQFRKFRTPTGGIPLFLSKAKGVNHGGGVIRDRAALDSLTALEKSFESEGDETCQPLVELDPIKDLKQTDIPQTWRKAAMMLGGRLPTAAEMDHLAGLKNAGERGALIRLLDDIMKTPAFHSWLKYTWNEIFMFRGLWAADITFPHRIVSLSDFATRTWGFLNRGGAPMCDAIWNAKTMWEHFAYPSLESCKDPRFRRLYLTRRVAYSLIEGPLEFIAWIVENEKPFSEILTSETIMMNFYSSLVYFGSALPSENPYVAQNPDLPIDTLIHPAGSPIQMLDIPSLHEYRPMHSVRRTRKYRSGGAGSPLNFEYNSVAEFPRAGLLTSQIWLNRYPTTDTNVNRHRTWAFMNQFLGVDILSLANRVVDPTAAEIGSTQPTIDDSNCNVCHNVMDPVAGLFQDFGKQGSWNARKVWPPNDQPPMIGPGSSIIGNNPGVEFDENVNGLPIQWLAKITVEDPKFSSTMVRHASRQLTGHMPMDVPIDTEVPGWRGLRKAYELESKFLNDLASGFVRKNMNMKWVYKQIILSPYFRALAPVSTEVIENEDRSAGLKHFGTGDQLLTPFELHRKIEAIIERPWQKRAYKMRNRNLNTIDEMAPENDFLLRFNSDNDFGYVDDIFRDMYGGIDFLNNTRRQTLPSSVMAAAGRRIAYEFACAVVAQDFALTAKHRVLFGDAKLGIRSILRFKNTIRKLYQRMIGRAPKTSEVQSARKLYDSVISSTTMEALPIHCHAIEQAPGQIGVFTPITSDDSNEIRAWMAVVAYLALDPQFLFEW